MLKKLLLYDYEFVEIIYKFVVVIIQNVEKC